MEGEYGVQMLKCSTEKLLTEGPPNRQIATSARLAFACCARSERDAFEIFLGRRPPHVRRDLDGCPSELCSVVDTDRPDPPYCSLASNGIRSLRRSCERPEFSLTRCGCSESPLLHRPSPSHGK